MINFKKNNSRENIPLTWRRLDDTSASVICPNGHKGTLEDHTINKDGIVNPSVVCTYYCETGTKGEKGHKIDECNFHEYIKLDDWKD